MRRQISERERRRRKAIIARAYVNVGNRIWFDTRRPPYQPTLRKRLVDIGGFVGGWVYIMIHVILAATVVVS